MIALITTQLYILIILPRDESEMKFDKEFLRLKLVNKVLMCLDVKRFIITVLAFTSSLRNFRLTYKWYWQSNKTDNI